MEKLFLSIVCVGGTLCNKSVGVANWRNIDWNSRGVMGTFLHANNSTGIWSSSQHTWFSRCKMSFFLMPMCFSYISWFSLLVGSVAAAPQQPTVSKGHCVWLIPLQCHRAACAPTKHLHPTWFCFFGRDALQKSLSLIGKPGWYNEYRLPYDYK